MIEDAKARAATTYNAAADHFDAAPLGFWERIGKRTIELASLRHGAHVLDACCGSGASAIPAAEAVGSSGRVVGVDLAENLLALARAKAHRRNLRHTEFKLGDIEALDSSVERFDAVICVFGIFFLPDMPAGVRSLWRLLRPGGRLVLTTWGPRVLEPGSTAFWNAVRDERPDLYKNFNPWDRINETPALAAMLAEGGVQTTTIVAEQGVQLLGSPEDFWTIVLGSGYRSTVEQLDSAGRERVRGATLARLAARNIRSVETNAIFAVADKL